MSTVNRVFEIVERMREDKSLPWQLRSQLEELQWYEGYANGRDAPKGVVAANWNDATMSRLEKLFSHYGVEIEWSDQVSMCDECYKCIQTAPNCWSWRPEFHVGDGSIVCAKCLEADPGQALEDSEGGMWNIDSIDPSDHGYTQIDYDTRRDYADQVKADIKRAYPNVRRFLITNPSQYEWNVYVHNDELEMTKPKAYEHKGEGIPVSEADYSDARENYSGWCPHCEEFTRDSTEPDADGYDCPSCDAKDVCGAEMAMVKGWIEITE